MYCKNLFKQECKGLLKIVSGEKYKFSVCLTICKVCYKL